MWTGRVTSGGRALFAEWASGKIITITRAAAGPQRYDQSALYECTDLLQKTQDLKITTVTKDRGGVEVNLRFTAADQTYFAAQIGIWAKLDDGDETMIAIYQTDTSGIEIPSKDRLTDFVYTFHALISASVDAEYRVVVDATTLATKSDVNEVKYEIRPILYGGTGASSAAGALKNLGAVSKTGDKMTGSLSTTMLTIDSASNMTPNITFNNQHMKESVAKAVYDAYRGQFYIQYDVDGNGYYETYNLPIFTGNRKAIGKFDILTSKKAVSIAQGGTGATSAAAARSALDITPANIGAAKADHTHTVAADGITGTLGIGNGGTGATTAAAARTMLGITPSNIGAVGKMGDTMTGTLRIDSTASNGFVELREDDEGGNIVIGSKNGTYIYEIDAYSDEAIRLHNAPSHQATGDWRSITWNARTGDFNSDSFSGTWNGEPISIAKGGTGATTLSGLHSNVLDDQGLDATTNILTLPNGFYHREGKVSKEYGWPYDSETAWAEVFIWGNRNGSNGYWSIFIVSVYTGKIFVNTHHWDTWIGWKQINTTEM